MRNKIIRYGKHKDIEANAQKTGVRLTLPVLLVLQV